MKLAYEAPVLELEEFVLNERIAANCKVIINIYALSDPPCDDFGGDIPDLQVNAFAATYNDGYGGNGWTCECEMNSGNEPLQTS